MEYAQTDSSLENSNKSGQPVRQRVSALVITKNEEKHITRCLSSLTWADEIVVVDADSTDKTRDLCQALDQPWSEKIRFFSRSWTGFKDQRNFSLQQASHPWVFVVDADEACSPELSKRILDLLSNPTGPKFPAYKVRRVEYFLNRPITYGIWNPSYQDRFFDRRGVQYTNNVHEYPVFKTPPQHLHEPLYHAPDFNIDRFLDKMNRYTSLEARARVEEGQRTNPFRMITAFPAMFLKNYFYYKAYRDGISGFVISILEGISRAVRHVKMWECQRKIEQTK